MVSFAQLLPIGFLRTDRKEGGVLIVLMGVFQRQLFIEKLRLSCQKVVKQIISADTRLYMIHSADSLQNFQLRKEEYLISIM